MHQYWRDALDASDSLVRAVRVLRTGGFPDQVHSRLCSAMAAAKSAREILEEASLLRMTSETEAAVRPPPPAPASLDGERPPPAGEAVSSPPAKRMSVEDLDRKLDTVLASFQASIRAYEAVPPSPQRRRWPSASAGSTRHATRCAATAPAAGPPPRTGPPPAIPDPPERAAYGTSPRAPSSLRATCRAASARSTGSGAPRA